ncbi:MULTISPECIES: DNA internalization-related competence protein ComEC/Rec2 [Lactobacillus]|uniref:DNA internalization-related competence protein ComEC/Rec2 n=1 Tax=Lactobacillus xujianguonis TaxID=2495899 RepID=A0A437SUU0_9LACO|nr:MULTISPECIES: DNA internalization-related competence protein ComEC/Rec2 [Lactobacillus]RVU70652.1 DNA internalization-related competence protein ComEC/Rec2 [Lactobacillus xujianguonis]RVU73253.1 DNA internalization-related competence protein ComEC/Rec2 [Lactobacillus xujianguonis]
MQGLKINWKYSFNQLGFWFLTALLFVAASFYFFEVKTTKQEIIVLMMLGYLLLLILFKYQNFSLLLIIAAIFLTKTWLVKQPHQLTVLSDQTLVKIFPDEVKVTDGWLSGTGHSEVGKILLSGNIDSSQEELFKTGKTVIASHFAGELGPIDPATNLGEFDYQAYYAAEGITQKIKFKSCRLLPQSITWQDQIHQIRFKFQQFFRKMPRLLGFFASELILAENSSPDNKEVIDNYRDLGVIHLLSISGLHVGIYTLVVSSLCFYLKITEDKAFILCLIVLTMGILLSDGQAGFVRASLTYVLGKISKFKKIKMAGIDILGLTCLLHLCLYPRLFMGIGAILSYVLALGLQLTSKFSKFGQAVSLNLFLTPLLLLFFFQVNLLTVIFNLLVVPYFNWVVLPITFINLVCFSLLPKLSEYLENILLFFEKLIGQLSHTKLGLVTFGKITWWQCLLLLIVTSCFLMYLNEKELLKKIKYSWLGAVVTLYISFFVMIHCPLKGQVSFIDVGQGDSILITTPFPRRVYLIDTGGKLNFSGKKQTPQVNRITIPLLKALGINKIDGIFVSHQDADHVGDVRPLLEQVQVDKLFMAQGLIKNPSFKKRVDGVVKHTQLVELIAGMQVKEPKINFQVVYPFKPGEGKNEDSLSLTFEVAHKRWLFTGDLGQEGEKQIMQRYQLHADYFKLGHHGSKTSSNPEFLQALKPQLVFISAGRNNRFGHPHQETLNTLRQQNIPWVSTQDCGMISWYYDQFNHTSFNRFVRKENE